MRDFFERWMIKGDDSNLKLAMSIGWGVFCGIVPIWGYQMLFTLISSHFFKLNKTVAFIFSNISIPPVLPFILYGSIALGNLIYPSGFEVTFAFASFDKIADLLVQYIIGSLLLAIIMGLLFCIVSYLVLIRIRKNKYE